MGHTILTPHQSIIVELAAGYEEITRWYYFTGGTALSEYYLHHRLSEDLDFFTRSQVNDQKMDVFFREMKQKGLIVGTEKHRLSGLFQYSVMFADNDIVKVDFNEYDFPQVETGLQWRKLRIDSLYDIAVNKLASVLSRNKSRDFVDLFHCIEVEGCSLEQLFSRLPDKFGITYDDSTIIRQFSHVLDITDYPTMLVQFDRQKMVDFFLAEAKKLEYKIFK